MRGENAIQESFFIAVFRTMLRLDDICFLTDLVCVDKREI